MVRWARAVALLALAGCAAMRPAPPNAAPDDPSAIALRRADNDFSPLAERDGTPEPVPGPVRARLAAMPRVTGPVYVMQLPSGVALYAAHAVGRLGDEVRLVAWDATSAHVSPLVATVSTRRSAGDDGPLDWHPPFVRFEDLDGDGTAEILVQSTWAVGGRTTSIVTRVFKLDDALALTRVADFLTGDHFVWARNPAGVWVVGDVRRQGADRIRIDYVCHPLGRPHETRPIGAVAFRWSPRDGGFVEDGARVVDGHFADFLRLDAR